MTGTIVKVEKDEVYICRFIHNKLHKIVFNKNVKLVEVEEYFSISDDLFIKCCLHYM